MNTRGKPLQLPSFSDANDAQRIGMLVSLRDRERHEPSLPLPGEFMVLIHQGLAHRKAVRIEAPAHTQLVGQIEAEDPRQHHQLRRRAWV